MSAQSQGSLDGPWVKAIQRRDAKAVESLLAGGANIEEPLFADATPAVFAAAGDGWDIVLLLLQRGADPAAIDEQGFSIATFAKTSRVAPDNKYGRALAEVKEILRAKGLM